MYNLDGILIRECLELRQEHKQRLITILQDSMNNDESDDSRFKVLLSIATELCGNGIMTRTIEPKSSLGRNMIAYQLRQEGYNSCHIGRLLERNHSTVCAMIAKINDLIEYPDVFVDEEAVWKEFQKRLKEHDEKCM